MSYYFWLGADAPLGLEEYEDTWAKLATAYGCERDGFITVHPSVR